ncbi:MULTISPECIES: shikimate kinase [Thermococcus]|uniref:shikimate kinase n=1 Tax=Thermococcus TaxID=2263 RepID=UPI0018231346|nr:MULTISPECIES: shikimate kinase [Thermococcus]MBC7094619.1 shikimate kinase [Thermococcus sp.]HII67903.1 shikimate kinase [Thermococcaceae archaeon]
MLSSYTKLSWRRLKVMGKAFSAVTVINAFATGKGGAIGINLRVNAKVKLTDEGISGEIFIRGEKFEDFSLVKAVTETIRNKFGLDFGVKVKIDSEIPIGKGLKSSSAVANALTEAILEELKIELPNIEVVKLGVEAAKRASVTLTGAFDDACASYFGGLCLTDNLKLELLKREEVEKIPVVLLIPKETVLTSSLRGRNFRVLSPYIEEAFKLALRGEWKKALVLNGLMYGPFLGYNLEPIVKALGIEAVAGLSGKGPAMFAITEEPEKIVEIWKDYGEVLTTTLR